MPLWKHGIPGLLMLVSAGGTQAGAYLGANVGIMDVTTGAYDNATNAGLLLGYTVHSREVFSVSLEAEFTTTVSEGDLNLQVDGDWEVDTQAAYVAIVLGEAFYGKVRFGMLREDFTFNVDGESFSDTDTGGSWSAAVGWNATSHWALQLESTLIDGDINYWNLGVHYRF